MRGRDVSADYAAERSCRVTAFGGLEELKLPFQLQSRSSVSGKRIVLRLDYGYTDECRSEHRKADRLMVGCHADIRSDGGDLLLNPTPNSPNPRRHLSRLFVLFLKKMYLCCDIACLRIRYWLPDTVPKSVSGEG